MHDGSACSGAPDSAGQTPQQGPETAAEKPPVLSPSAAVVAKALADLEPDEREVILDAFLGASYREIAANRGLSEATVKSSTRRGLTRLAAIMRRIRTITPD